MVDRNKDDTRVPVWDRLVRVFHWSLAACFLTATLLPDDGDAPHRWLGYACLALVAIRLVWGMVGSHYARFSQFLPRPAFLFAYLRGLVRGKEERYLGHNPAGAIMIVLLLLGVTTAGISGWLLTTDWFWGDDFMENLHEVVAYGTLSLVVIHVAGVLYASFRHKENLIAAMFTGYKKSDPAR